MTNRGYRDNAVVTTSWELAWRRGSLGALWDIFGALVMIPFGLLLAASVVAFVFTASDVHAGLARMWHAEQWGALVGNGSMLALGVSGGVWFSWVLLSSGFGMGLDCIGLRRTVEGTITNKRTHRGSKGGRTRYIDIAGETLLPGAEAYETVREGERYRIEFGRFERTVYTVWRFVERVE